jgi:hypothetical protein
MVRNRLGKRGDGEPRQRTLHPGNMRREMEAEKGVPLITWHLIVYGDCAGVVHGAALAAFINAKRIHCGYGRMQRLRVMTAIAVPYCWW